MKSPSPLLPLIVIAGPTASGKSALALALSRLVPATIINADASQVYADLRILSARPSTEEEAQAPHRLFGHVDGAADYSAAQWAAEARSAIVEAHDAERLPILVGGTGLYIRTLLEGIAPVPEIDAEVRSAVRALSVEQSYAALTREDPAAAARLNRNDTTRIARALEVMRSTRRPLSDWQKERSGGLGDSVDTHGMLLLPPREWLHARCNARFDQMIAAGAVEEVKRLRARKLDPALPVMRAIGVREISLMIDDAAQAEAAREAGKAATRQYAKRQYTWFRNQPPPDWIRVEQQLDDDYVNKLVIKLRDMPLTR